MIVRVIAYLILAKSLWINSAALAKARSAAFRIRGAKIASNALLQPGVQIYGCRNVSIGGGVFIGMGTKMISYAETLVIEDDVLIAGDCIFLTRSHNYSELTIPIKSQGYTHAPIKVGKGAWLGFRCTVLAGVTIGEGAIVGAHSVVTKDIPPFTIYGGVPAKFLKLRADLDAVASA